LEVVAMATQPADKAAQPRGVSVLAQLRLGASSAGAGAGAATPPLEKVADGVAQLKGETGAPVVNQDGSSAGSSCAPASQKDAPSLLSLLARLQRVAARPARRQRSKWAWSRHSSHVPLIAASESLGMQHIAAVSVGVSMGSMGHDAIRSPCLQRSTRPCSRPQSLLHDNSPEKIPLGM